MEKKLRLQKLQEAADLDNAMQLFGAEHIRADTDDYAAATTTGGSKAKIVEVDWLDSLKPETQKDFDLIAEKLTKKLKSFEVPTFILIYLFIFMYLFIFILFLEEQVLYSICGKPGQDPRRRPRAPRNPQGRQRPHRPGCPEAEGKVGGCKEAGALPGWNKEIVEYVC